MNDWLDDDDKFHDECGVFAIYAPGKENIEKRETISFRFKAMIFLLLLHSIDFQFRSSIRRRKRFKRRSPPLHSGSIRDLRGWNYKYRIMNEVAEVSRGLKLNGKGALF